MTDRRTVIADAAITTIAREGLRGFTHRAVDRAASLAEGSTSYYFRTREALMFAALARMAELDVLDIGELPELSAKVDMDALTSLLTELVWRWLTEARERTLARYELSLESTRRPALRMRLMSHGAAFRVMAEQTIAAAGGSESARRAATLVAHLDGLLLHQLTRVDPTELDRDGIRAACRDLLTMALS